MFIDPIHLAIIPMKAIEAGLFLYLLILLRYKIRSNKNKGINLQKIFSIAFLGWFLYIFLDIFIFVCAPISLRDQPVGTYSVGYDINFKSVFIINIMRDIALYGGNVLTWSYIIAAYFVRFGQEKTIKNFIKNKYFIIGVNILTILLSYGDRISVYVSDIGPIVSAEFTGLGVFSLFLTITLFGFSATYLGIILVNTTKESKSSSYRRKVKLLLTGTIFMGLGHFYWVILGILTIEYPLFFSQLQNPLFLYIFGHIMWTASPIFISLALKENKM